jgi:hypothetical protein
MSYSIKYSIAVEDDDGNVLQTLDGRTDSPEGLIEVVDEIVDPPVQHGWAGVEEENEE